MITKQQKNMTLNKDVTDEAERKIEGVGGKLSGLVESLLKKFNKGEIKI